MTAAILTQVQAPQAGPVPQRSRGPVPWSEFEAWLLALYKLKRAPVTCRGMARTLREFQALTGVERTDQVDEILVATYTAAMPAARSDTTRRWSLAMLRAACGWARKRGHLADDPFAKWGIDEYVPRPASPEPRIPTPGEMCRVVESLRSGIVSWHTHRTYALVYTLWHTGLRAREALYLRRDDVRLNELGRPVLDIHPCPRHRLKTAKSAGLVPCPGRLPEILAEWMARNAETAERCPWLFPGVWRRGPWIQNHPASSALESARAAGAAVGVPGLTLRVLRHCFATHGRHWGMTDLEVQIVLRHTTTATQRHYVHPDLAKVREEIWAVNFEAHANRPIPPENGQVEPLETPIRLGA